MSLIKCSECGREISNNASVCIHCGNPTENYLGESKKIMNNSEYKSFYDLSEDERIDLEEEFVRKIGKSEERGVYVLFLTLSIFVGIFFCLGLISTLEYDPLLENSYFYVVIVCVLVFIGSIILIDKDNKDREKKFVVWLSTSKRIKK